MSRSEEHTSELQSLTNLVCRLLLEKKKKTGRRTPHPAADKQTRPLRRRHQARTCPSTLPTGGQWDVGCARPEDRTGSRRHRHAGAPISTLAKTGAGKGVAT